MRNRITYTCAEQGVVVHAEVLGHLNLVKQVLVALEDNGLNLKIKLVFVYCKFAVFLNPHFEQGYQNYNNVISGSVQCFA